MTINTQAFLRGYMHEKTAVLPLVARGALTAGRALAVERAGTGAWAWWQRGARKRKAAREKRYTDQLNKDFSSYTEPKITYPGYDTPEAHRAALIAKGQAEAKRHREAGTTPQQTEWNKEDWRTLFQPKAKGTSMYPGGGHKLPSPTQKEIQEARDAMGK